MCVKNNTEEWVNEETFEAIRVRDNQVKKINKQTKNEFYKRQAHRKHR